jgi:LacI family transcriptional regulator
MLAGSKTDTIGVILPVLDNGYYVQVLRGVDRVSTKENLKLMISFYHSDSDLLGILGSVCGEGRTDAVILMNNMFFSPEKIRELAGDKTPIALIGQNHGTIPAIDSVVIDNMKGAYAAVELLMKSEPASLLLLTGPENNFDSCERLAGAQEAVQDAGISVDVATLTGDFYHEGGRRVFEEYVHDRGRFPDAVFAFNDAMALGVLDVLEEAGKRVPEDVQVVGFDNNEIAQYIGLSTISVPMEQIGVEAARLVTERIRNKDAAQSSLTMETALIARKTTA